MIEHIENIEDAVYKYYKLKNKYMDTINKKKQNILNDDNIVSFKDKRKKWKKTKISCINCNRNGGSIFFSKNKVLTAICGHIEPCNLNIKINRGDFYNIRSEENLILNELNNIKNNIIRIKLDLLFNFNDEKNTIKLFEKAKKELLEYGDYLSSIRKKYIEIINNTKNKEKILEYRIKLNSEIEFLNNLHKSYKESEEPSIITTMVETYISSIEVLTSTLRELKYNNPRIEKIDNNYKLIEETYSLNNLYVSKIEPKIISDKK